MAVVALIAFGLFTFTGDPVTFMVGQDATQEQRAQLRSDLGLDQPFYVQFGRFLGRALHGEFGLSLRQGRPVATLLKERLPATLELATTAAVLALVLGIPSGVYTALKRHSWFSQVLLTVSLVGVSLPTFLIGILLILIFAVILGWLPSFGRGETEAFGWWTTGLLTNSGLNDRAIHFGHALKNTLVPVITITGLQLGSIIAFAIITETVFQWPGMGLMFIQAVNFADIPVMAAYLVLVGLFFVVINLVVDLLYYVVDPRLRIDRERAAGV